MKAKNCWYLEELLRSCRELQLLDCSFCEQLKLGIRQLRQGYLPYRLIENLQHLIPLLWGKQKRTLSSGVAEKWSPASEKIKLVQPRVDTKYEISIGTQLKFISRNFVKIISWNSAKLRKQMLWNFAYRYRLVAKFLG
jgi:hypothetical protein